MEIALTVVCFLLFWIYVSFNWYSWKINLELWEMKRNKNKTRITKSKSYKSVDELWEDLDKKEVWHRRVLLHIKCKIEQFFDIPRDVYRFFKKGIQRWARGWSDEDVWGINYFLSEIIPPMLKRLKETKHGVPCIVGKMETDKEMEEAEKQWDEVLDSIIYTFEVSKNISESNLFYQPSEEWSRKEANKYNKIWIDWKYEPKPRAMTKEECKRYELGWSNLKKFFYSMWD
jgi:hypothetical protein